MKNYEKPNFELKNLDILDIITVSNAIDGVIDKKGNSLTETINFDELNV